ncbi:chaperonin 10-like protein [Aspergillus avenaceus]|uniref:Chaperonin 10-like protein n=1 Tax=Aspergillus avenaceus TaxID=36643 RepID=A0A5N6TU03_ASPAV|nr:chaperonin 10-like protein [Aspergillus avenaceus]
MPVLPKTYKAWVIPSVGAPLELQEVELKLPAAGEILVRVRACGVCFTDVAVQKSELGNNLFPRIPGHEIIGDIVAVGEGAQGLSLGQRIGGTWLGGHDNVCRSCRRGSQAGQPWKKGIAPGGPLHMNIDSPRRHLCTPDPAETHYLPISDDDWNSGVGCRLPYTVSAPTNNKMGKFARLAQASHLLARVMRHICDTQADSHFLDTEKGMLDLALRSLLTLTVAEEQQCGIAYCSPVAFVSSALLLLHSFHLGASPSVNKESASYCYREVTELTCKVTLPIARRLKELSSSDAHAPCPLLLDWMYRSVIAYNTVRETDTTVLLSGKRRSSAFL